MFNPTLSTQLHINGASYRFSEHPAVPRLVWGQEGRRGVVYRIEDTRTQDAFGLKVFRPAHRRPTLIDAAKALTRYSKLPGMRVAEQTVLTHENLPDVIGDYEDLEYAMVMPWIEGKTWFDHLNLRNEFSLRESRLLARHLARVLGQLEANDLAHCDLSSANVIVNPSLTELYLVDLEDLYGPDMPRPPSLPAGSQGYQHKTSASGQWSALGDRFAGAILIGEVLGWAHPAVRTRRYGESYFDPDELQKNTTRFRVLRGVLRIHDQRLAAAFEQAWRSPTLEDCPVLAMWYDLLQDLPLDGSPEYWQAFESDVDAEVKREHKTPIQLPRILLYPDRLLAVLLLAVMVVYMVGVFVSTLFN